MTNNNADEYADAMTASNEAMRLLASSTDIAVTTYSTGTGGLDGVLRELRNVEREANNARRAIASQARMDGYTWAEIGAALDMSKQAVQQHYGR